MKKLILSAAIMTFTVAVYAGQSCDGSACCSKAKTTETKAATCPYSHKTVTKAAKHGASRQALQSPKAMSLA